MSHFTLRAEFEDGRNVEFVPEHIYPLGISDLSLLAASPSSPLKLTIEGNRVVMDGDLKDGKATINTTITFGEQPLMYALVPGGWLPPPCVIPPRFLIDRNVVISLRKIRTGKASIQGKAIEWWSNLLDSNGSAILNPLPYAYESGFRRKPTISEFAAAYDDGVHELTQAFPNCKVIQYDERSYAAAYAQLEAFDRRTEREVLFARDVAPLVCQRVHRHQEAGRLKDILALADKHTIGRGSLITLTALSCLYEDPTGTTLAIGRKILKPVQDYSEEDAFNAISDLRHIEIAAAGQTYFEDGLFSLCTADRGLAMLWAALSMRGQVLSASSIEFTFDLTQDLFFRLAENEIQSLRERLKGDA
jgi:hypothetical protein